MRALTPQSKVPWRKNDLTNTNRRTIFFASMSPLSKDCLFENHLLQSEKAYDTSRYHRLKIIWCKSERAYDTSSHHKLKIICCKVNNISRHQRLKIICCKVKEHTILHATTGWQSFVAKWNFLRYFTPPKVDNHLLQSERAYDTSLHQRLKIICCKVKEHTIQKSSAVSDKLFKKKFFHSFRCIINRIFTG